ncbi:MAG: sigma-70 family RNA polymerase sigma factor [Alcanivorax sp.]
MATPSKLDELSDEELMIRIQSSDHEAFSLLVMRHTKMFYAAAYRMYPYQDEAEDIVQEAFLKLWRKPDMWKTGKGAKFTTWFYRVVTNLAIDYARKKKDSKGSDVLDRITDNTPDQQDTMEGDEQQKLLEDAIQELPERQKMALNLCFYEELSNKEAAEIMDIGVKALESLLMRAKSGLRDILTRQGLLNEEESGRHYYGS